MPPSPTDKLTIFRNEVGINTVQDLTAGVSKRPAANEGIYKRTVDAEYWAYVNYIATAILINTCLLLQIVVAAALTALGAAEAPHNFITLLGILNTAVAGVLTYMKGQNLPNRLRQYWNGLRKLREHIEQRERDFCNPNTKLDVEEEVRIIVQTYDEVRQEAEDNEPDSYVSTRGAGPKKTKPKSAIDDPEAQPLLDPAGQPSSSGGAANLIDSDPGASSSSASKALTGST
ncbi:MAG: hypothetical protein MMC33_002522 [Icmadophila ericetorum]|nr:hypothetical protein [Icmadophila ericetorum]